MTTWILWRTASIVTMALALSGPGQAQATALGGPALVWENRGQPQQTGTAFATIAQGGVIVAAGEVGTQTAHDPFIRAVDAATGSTLWEDRVASPGTFERFQDLAADGQRVYASGWVFNARHVLDLFVRAYSLPSGRLLWERRVGDKAVGEGIVVAGGRVFVVGRLVDASGRKDFTLLALDAGTGTTLWQSLTDPAHGAGEGRAFAVRAEGEQLFVAGTVYGAAGASLLVRAHDARTGHIRWEQEVPDAANDFDRNRALAVGDGLLFVGGVALTPDEGNPEDWMIRAYDMRTGALLWVDRDDLQEASP